MKKGIHTFQLLVKVKELDGQVLEIMDTRSMM